MENSRAMRLVIGKDRLANDRSRQLILQAIAQARHWYQRIVNGQATCLNDIIRRDSINASHAKKIFQPAKHPDATAFAGVIFQAGYSPVYQEHGAPVAFRITRRSRNYRISSRVNFNRTPRLVVLAPR
jgi:hypothetical protein